jgi:hypothetical protein
MKLLQLIVNWAFRIGYKHRNLANDNKNPINKYIKAIAGLITIVAWNERMKRKIASLICLFLFIGWLFNDVSLAT